MTKMVPISLNADPPSSSTGAGTTNSKPKEKRRNNEKRKEKSRDAARFRRSRETEIFTELAQVLPLKKEDINQLDKASVMRIAIANLKIRSMLDLFPRIQELTADIKTDNDAGNDSNCALSEQAETTVENGAVNFDLLKCAEATQLIKQTLDGFLIILSNDGDITYVSDNITEYLGIAKIDILGQQIWEYSHQCDHAELKEALNIKRNGLADKIKNEHLLEEGSTDHRDLFVRFKCTLTSRGRSINIKSASYKVIHITGHLVVNTKGERALIAIGRPIPHPSNIEIPLGTTTFLTKHSLDMKFTYVDDKMLTLFDYESDDLLGKSLFGCYHGADSDSLMGTFKTVLSKGQGETCRYRFLGKHGGYCWIVTQATIVYDKLKPQSVVCVNYVISNLENNNEIYSLAQYEASKKKLEETSKNNNNKNNNSHSCKDEVQNTIETTTAATNISKQEQEISIISTTKTDTNITNNENIIKQTKPKIENNLINIATTEPQLLQTQTKTARLSPISTTVPTTTTTINKNNELLIVNNIKSENIPISNTTLPQIPQTVNQHILIDNKPIILRDQSISPIRHNLETNCVIGNKPFIKEEKRPKSVTASVFKAAPITTASYNNKLINKQPQQQQQQQFVTKTSQQTQPTQPQIQDMNKGFLTFAEDATELTMLKEEPDDLQHMVTSNVVDACMPLDETSPLLSEMLDGFINSYLSDDINSLDSTTSSTTDTTQALAGNVTSATAQNCNNSNSNNNISNKATQNIDPFINYREESNDTNCSQHLLSPSVTSKSPEANSLPSLCSPTSLSQEDDFAFMTMSGDDEIDLTTRAPYIPMDEQDNVPLLTDDLMWCSNNAFTADDFNLYKEADAMQQLHMQQQQQQQQQCETSRNILSYQQQNDLTQQHFSNSLCSSPASTVSSLSPSPVNHHQQQQQQQDAVAVFGTDSSELAALLCGSGNGTLSILGNSCGGTDDSDGSSMSCSIVSNGGVGNSSSLTLSPTQTQQQQLQQATQCATMNGNVGNNFRLQDIQQEILQEQRQQLLGLNIDCKKEKYDHTLAPSLCDSIVDAFDNVYSKDSTNLDCWNELLQINVNDPTSNTSSATCSPIHQHLSAQQLDSLNTQDCKQQLDLQQQNIILNTVPLIAIQSNKNIMLQQQLQQSQRIINDVVGGVNNSNNSNNEKMVINDDLLAINCNGNKISTITLLNGATRKPITTTATIRVVDNKIQQQAEQLQQQLQRAQAASKAAIIQTITPQHQQQQQQQHGSKRHLTSAIATTQIETKRLKSGAHANATIIDLQATPQLLQQLMAPAQQTTTLNVKEQQKQQQHEQQQQQRSKNVGQRWSSNAGSTKTSSAAVPQHQHQQQQQQQQQSNSVLKNLLDATSTKVEPMYVDDNSADQTPLSPLGLSPGLTKPLHCVTNAESLLRNSQHNPMIGGPGVLPSPLFGQLDDSNPPGLTACDTDSASDSGIDDISIGESCSPLKMQLEKSEELNTNFNNFTPHQINVGQKEELFMKCIKANLIKTVAGAAPPYNVSSVPPSLPTPQTTQILNKNTNNAADMVVGTSSGAQSRKNSLTVLLEQSNNPLNTPFLMELGNDDYNMNADTYLETNDIENVLNEWTHEMV